MIVVFVFGNNAVYSCCVSMIWICLMEAIARDYEGKRVKREREAEVGAEGG